MKKLYLAMAILSLSSCNSAPEIHKVSVTVTQPQIILNDENDYPYIATKLGDLEGCSVYLIRSIALKDNVVIPVCKTDIVVDPLAVEKDPQIPTWELNNVKK